MLKLKKKIRRQKVKQDTRRRSLGSSTHRPFLSSCKQTPPPNVCGQKVAWMSVARLRLFVRSLNWSAEGQMWLCNCTSGLKLDMSCSVGVSRGLSKTRHSCVVNKIQIKRKSVVKHNFVFDCGFCVDKKNQLDATFCILYFSSNSCSTCFVQLCAHHQELTTA